MKLRRVDFVRTVPSPTSVATPVPFLEVFEGKPPMGHPERYVASLEERHGFIWVGDVGYPRECVARVILLSEPKKNASAA